MKRTVLISSLILALLLSSIIRIRFNFYGGFTFYDFWMTFPLAIFDFARNSSNQLQLTSTIFGYLFYFIIALFLFDKTIFTRRITSFAWYALIILTGFAFYFECSAFLKDFNGQFTGSHFRIGPLLFIIGLTLYYEMGIIKNWTVKNEDYGTEQQKT
jgi:hypothetical protein